MIEQEQSPNEVEYDMHVSIICALTATVRDNWKYRDSGILRTYLKRDIAALRMAKTSKLFSKKI